jgi:RNA polymerase sigma-70 factor (ECF subfamily)
MDTESQETSDEILINASLTGDDQAFTQLVTRYKRRIFALAARFARDRDELEDICQEVFIKVYENLGNFRRDAPFEHWILRIATRECYDALHGRRHEINHSILDDRNSELRNFAEEARQNAREARELLRCAMARLNPKEQLIITLIELEELTVREAAALTGWSESNVKVRAYRARKALKRILEGEDERIYVCESRHAVCSCA